MDIIRDAGSLYTKFSLKVLAVSFTLALPLFFVQSLMSLTASMLTDLIGIWGQVISFSLFIICWSLVQVPYITMVYQEVDEGDIELNKAYWSFFQHFFPIITIAVFFAAAVVLGITLWVIPGVLAFALFCLFPCGVLMEGKWKQGIKNVWNIGWEQLFRIMMIHSVFVLVLMLVGQSILYCGSLLSLGVYSTALLMALTTSLLIPLFTFVQAYYYLEWTDLQNFNV